MISTPRSSRVRILNARFGIRTCRSRPSISAALIRKRIYFRFDSGSCLTGGIIVGPKRELICDSAGNSMRLCTASYLSRAT